MKTYTSLLVLGVLATSSIHAQDTTDSNTQTPEPKQATVESTQSTSDNSISVPLESAISETTFITASRSERPVETIAGNVTVITREDINKTTARNLSDVLKNQVGIDVRNTYGTANTNRIDIRGFGEVAEANTLILIDGRKNTRSDLASPDLSTIPLSRIERIEIYRGGRSVIYGDNATGGVINIITKRGSTENHTLKLTSEVGSNETYRFGAVLDGYTENLRYSVDASHSETDGYHDNNHERIKSGGFSVSSTEFENWTIDLAGGTSEREIGLFSGQAPNGKHTSAANETAYYESKEQYISLNPKYAITKDVDLELHTSYREAQSTLVYPGSYQGEVRSNDFQIGPKATFRNEFSDFNNTFVTGYDYSDSRSNQYNTFAASKVRHRTTNGVYLYNSSAFIDETVFLDLGYRREHISYDSSVDGGDFDSHNVDAFSLGLTWNYSDRSKVFASFDRSFRSQRVDEGGGPTFDEGLDPQISETYQLGVSHQLTDKLTVDATYFYIDTQDEIFYAPVAAGLANRNTSYANTERQGIELSSNYQALENLSLFANYTYNDATLGKDSTSATNYDGNDIPAVPQQTANLGFSWDINESFNLNLAGKWADSYYDYGDYANSRQKNDGYIVVDTKITYNWEWLTIYGGCNNLFDHKYNESETSWATYTAPGITFFTGLEATFEF